jgi:hypothetical protein
MAKTEQINAVRAVARALFETVKEAGAEGAPAGPMYAACMCTGISLDQFEQIMGALVRTGQLRKEGHVYYA